MTHFDISPFRSGRDNKTMDEATSPFSLSSSDPPSSSPMASNDGFVNRRMILESRRRRHAASKKLTAADVAAQQRMALSAGGGDFSQRFNQDDDSEEQNKSLPGDKIGSSREDSDDDNNMTYFQNVLQTALGKDTSKQFEYLFQSPKKGQQLQHQGGQEEEEINLLDGIISSTSSSTGLVDEESHSTTSASQRSSSHQSISAASLLRRTLLDPVPTSTSSTASRRKFPQDASNAIVSPSTNDDDDLKRRLQQFAEEREQINALHELRRKRKLDMLPSRQKETERNQQPQGQGKRKPQLASPTSTATTSSTSTSTRFAEQRRNTATSMDEGTLLSPIDSRSKKMSKTSATPLWASLVSKTTANSEADLPEDLGLQNQKPTSTLQNELDDRKQRHSKNKEPWKSPLPNLYSNQDNVVSNTTMASEVPPYHSNRQQRQYQGGSSPATPSSSSNAVPNVATYSEQQQLNEHERLKVLLDYETDRRKDTEARLLALEMELKELKGRDEPILIGSSSASRTSAVTKGTTKTAQKTKTANESSQTPRRLLIQKASEAFGSLP